MRKSPPRRHALPSKIRRGRWSCCGAQNFCAALRRTPPILTAATRSSRFFCYWQRSIRSPHRPAQPSAAPLVICHCETSSQTGCGNPSPKPPLRKGRWREAPEGSLAPLPKGGWHGEAVTGGFFFPTAPAGHAGLALQKIAHTTPGGQGRPPLQTIS